jgi:glycosyltransferase involved in cell wall biosynthesis
VKRLLHFFWFNYHRRERDAGVYEHNNGEIQKWAERLLESRFDVHSTSCATQGRVTQSPRDILLGHPTWQPQFADVPAGGRSERDWVADNRVAAGAPCHPNTYLLMPWLPYQPQEWELSMPWFDAQVDAAKLVFAICAPIWYEQTMKLDDTTSQGRARSKLVRLNMCVNFDALDLHKQTFSPVGRRKVLHMSNLGTTKGFDLLLESTRGVTMPTVASEQLDKIEKGPVNIKVFGKEYAIDNLGRVHNGDDALIRRLTAEHDFYLHTSSMDAQATTILEFGARGLVPIVTPESGFESEHAIYLTRYADRNRTIIAEALRMPDEELRRRSAGIREQIRTRHSWREFYDTIAAHIERTCAH